MFSQREKNLNFERGKKNQKEGLSGTQHWVRTSGLQPLTEREGVKIRLLVVTVQLSSFSHVQGEPCCV